MIGKPTTVFLRGFDVGDPAAVLLGRIDRQRDRLDVALVEFRLQLGGQAQLGGADRGEVGRVRKQHHPGIARPVVELDVADGRILFEIGCGIAQS